MRSLLMIAVICGLTLSVQAQLPRGSSFWNGGVRLNAQTGPGMVGFSLSPEAHFLVSNHFTLGGSFSLGSTFERGVQILLFNPEARYYIPSSNPHSHFFLFARPEFFFPIDVEFGAENRTQLSAGGGWNIFLSPSVAVENRLFTTFKNAPLSRASSFLSNPSFRLESRLILFMSDYRESSFQPGIGKGSLMIGGSNLAIGYESNALFEQFNLSVTPRAGYFLSEQFVAGLGLPFTFNQGFFWDNPPFFRDRVYTNTIGIAPFIRWYPGKWSEIVRPFLDIEGTYLLTRFQDLRFSNPPIVQPPRHRYFLHLGGGINYFLSRTAALEAGLFFDLDTYNDVSQMGIQLGFQFFIAEKGE